MIAAAENLQILAAFLFWSLADLVLVGLWILVLVVLITILVKGLFDD